MRRHILVAASLTASAFLLNAPTVSAQTAPAGSVAVKTMFDRPVLSSDGVTIGMTKHLAVNVEDGDAPWVAIGGNSDAYTLIPVSRLSGGTASEPFRANMSAAEFRNAPKWPVARLAEINRPYFMGVLSDHYRHPIRVTPGTIQGVGEGSVVRFVGMVPSNVQAEDFTGRVKLLGDNIRLASGRTAPITDLLLDMRNSKVVEAAAHLGTQTVAVPFPSMEWTGTQQAFVADVSEGQLASAADWSPETIAQTGTVVTTPQTATIETSPVIPGRVFW
jgi:hypothetical protein